MTVKSSIALTDEQHGLVMELVKARRYLNVSGVLQQGTDLLRQRMHDEHFEKAALKALLSQRAAGAFVRGAQMEKSTARMTAEKRRALAVQK